MLDQELPSDNEEGDRESSPEYEEPSPPYPPCTKRQRPEGPVDPDYNPNDEIEPRKRNKLSVGIHKVEKLDKDGSPIKPKGILANGRNDCGVFVREKGKITWVNWKKVDDNEKERLWKLMKDKYIFPDEMLEAGKAATLKTMAKSLDEFKALSKIFIAMNKKNVHHHNLGPGGYKAKIPIWRRQEEEDRKAGRESKFSECTVRTRNWLFARLKKLAQKAKKLKGKEVDQELTVALETAEHRGRTRGFSSTARCIVEPEIDNHTLAEESFEEFQRNFFRFMKENPNYSQPMHVPEFILSTKSPQQTCSQTLPKAPSSVGSSSADTQRYPVDDIMEATPCSLMVTMERKGKTRQFKVAEGTACPGCELHTMQMPKECARVFVGRVIDDKFLKEELDYRDEKEGIETLEDAVNNFVAWHRMDIMIHTVSLTPVALSPAPVPDSTALVVADVHVEVVPRSPPQQDVDMAHSPPPSPTKDTEDEGTKTPHTPTPQPSPTKDKENEGSIESRTKEKGTYDAAGIVKGKALPPPFPKVIRTHREEEEKLPFDPAAIAIFFHGLGNTVKETPKVNEVKVVQVKRTMKPGVPEGSWDYEQVPGKRIFNTNDFDMDVPFEDIHHIYCLRAIDATMIILWYIYGLLHPHLISQGHLTPKIDEKSPVYASRCMKEWEDREIILAPYNFDNHWICLLINHKKGRVWILDSLDYDQKRYNMFCKVIEKGYEHYVHNLQGKHNPKRPYKMGWRWKFPCRKQPPGTNHCGYYVMDWLSLAVHHKFTNLPDEYPTKHDTTKKWLSGFSDAQLYGFTSRICRFIMHHLVHADGDYFDPERKLA
ncbi:hypothetical protein EJB05_40608, partial [Eragrostis curvula]